MPFSFPWTDASDADLPSHYLQWWWRTLATFSVDAWELNLCVYGRAAWSAVQGVATRDFPTLRFGETGSWLGRRFQGRGIGTAMRRAFCALLFDELGFEFVTSAAFTDNPASIRVSQKVGYRENGLDWQHPPRRAGHAAAHAAAARGPGARRADHRHWGGGDAPLRRDRALTSGVPAQARGVTTRLRQRISGRPGRRARPQDDW
jgi:RimJ/RimL family protein N-acetyltransferase